MSPIEVRPNSLILGAHIIDYNCSLFVIFVWLGVKK